MDLKLDTYYTKFKNFGQDKELLVFNIGMFFVDGIKFVFETKNTPRLVDEN